MMQIVPFTSTYHENPRQNPKEIRLKKFAVNVTLAILSKQIRT